MTSLKNRSEEELNQQAEINKQIELLEEKLRRRLNRDALLRYGNIKAANPEFAINILVAMNQVLGNDSQSLINDEDFKKILKSLQPKKRDFKIRRK